MTFTKVSLINFTKKFSYATANQNITFDTFSICCFSSRRYIPRCIVVRALAARQDVAGSNPVTNMDVYNVSDSTANRSFNVKAIVCEM